jgi:hypothetical protein
VDRFVIWCMDQSFEAVLGLDDDGLVIHYPDLAERL